MKQTSDMEGTFQPKLNINKFGVRKRFRVGKLIKDSVIFQRNQQKIWQRHQHFISLEKRKLAILFLKYLIFGLIVFLGIYAALYYSFLHTRVPIKDVINETFNFEDLMQEGLEKETVVPPPVEDNVKSRNERLKRMCKQGRRCEEIYKYHEDDTYSFYILDKYNITWCSVYKAASTTFMTNFEVTKRPRHKPPDEEMLANSSMPTPPEHISPKKEEIEKAIKNGYLSMIVVRHPFERMVAAYRDKMLNPEPKSEYDILRRIVTRDYRAWNSTNTNPYPTFTEYIKYVQDENRMLSRSQLHFIPYSKSCAVCKIKYDIILKQESLKADLEYLMQLKNETIIEKISKTFKNLGRRKKLEFGKSSPELTKFYFQKLRLSDVTKLYELYKEDFLLFDYDATEYFEMANHGMPVDELVSLEA